MLHAVVLGAAAGGGFPQWNSNTPACRRAGQDDAGGAYALADLANGISQRQGVICSECLARSAPADRGNSASTSARGLAGSGIERRERQSRARCCPRPVLWLGIDEPRGAAAEPPTARHRDRDRRSCHTDPACALSADHGLLAGTDCEAEQAAPDFVYRQHSGASPQLLEPMRQSTGQE